MVDSQQLPYILRLMDDESESVRLAVIKELAGFGPILEEELMKFATVVDESQIRIALYLVEDYKRLLSDGLKKNDEALFTSGQLVKHGRYGYRGVVVHVDMTCQAEEDWYKSNQTHPNRSQPWYHVLVHMSNQVTYAAQASLQADPSSREVIHPFLKFFFASFEDGFYSRNSRPWPEM